MLSWARVYAAGAGAPRYDRVVRKVFVSYHLDEAYRIRDLLREEGMCAEVTNEALIGGFGQLPMDITTLPTVWIADAGREAEADAVVARALERSERSPWRCEECDYVNEGQFTQCPTCGRDRPGDAL
jgi:hypothetical protein